METARAARNATEGVPYSAVALRRAGGPHPGPLPRGEGDSGSSRLRQTRCPSPLVSAMKADSRLTSSSRKSLILWPA